VSPGPAEAAATIREAIDGALLVTAYGSCRVEYDGRAASTLETGDRLLVLKPDGTALVHTDEGQKPVNWQPPGCAHAVEADDGTVLVRSDRESPDERLLVRFEQVGHVAAFDPTDQTDLELAGTEQDLRERILDDPSVLEPGFEPRATERATSAGAVDIYGEDGDGNAVAVELKRRRVGPDAVSQLNRYVDALSRELHADATVRGLLVAPSVTDRAAGLLERRGLEFVSLSPPGRGRGDDGRRG